MRVRAAGVDRGVWHLLTGLPYLARIAAPAMRPSRSPIRGTEFAGQVEAVGGDVSGVSVGDEVYGVCRTGSFAEYACAPSAKVAPKPARLSFEQAAAVPISGAHGAAGTARRRRGAARAAGADHGRRRRRGDVRGADREGVRRGGHRGVRLGAGRPRALARRRPGDRPHAGGLRRRPRALGPDPRQRRHPPAVAAPAGARAARDARARRRRGRRALARRLPAADRLRARGVAAHAPAAARA